MFAMARNAAAAARSAADTLIDNSKSMAIVAAVQVLKENQKAELQGALGKASSSETAEPFRNFYLTLTTLLNGVSIEAAKSFRIHRNVLKYIPYEEAQTDWDTLMSTVGSLAQKFPKASEKFNETFKNQVGAFRRCAAERAAAAKVAGAAMAAGPDSRGGTRTPVSPDGESHVSGAGAALLPPPKPAAGAAHFIHACSLTVLVNEDGAEMQGQLVRDCKELFECDDVDGVSQAASLIVQRLENDKSGAATHEPILCLVETYAAVAKGLRSGYAADLNAIKEAMPGIREMLGTLLEHGLFSQLVKPFHTGLRRLLGGCERIEMQAEVLGLKDALQKGYKEVSKASDSLSRLTSWFTFG